MSIGSRIKEARLNLDLTQEDVAKKLGVTKGAIANYENEVSTPKTELLLKLFHILKCDANFIYQDELEKNAINKNVSDDEKYLYFTQTLKKLGASDKDLDRMINIYKAMKE